MKKIITCLLAMALSVSLAACGTVIQNVNKDKTQVYVVTFEGGLGSDWLKEAATRFNERNPEYQVVVSEPSKDTYPVIMSSITAGVALNDVFFNVNPDYVELAIGDYLETLDDVMKMKPDGEDGKTIEEKLLNKDLFLKAFSLERDGKTQMYAMPFSDLVAGLVYDRDLFIKNNWLIQEDTEEYKLTAGRDGVYGTYDDGEPVTMEEFDMMLQAIHNDGSYPFNWAGAAVAYLTNALESVWAMYDGYDNYVMSFSYEGLYTPMSGEGFEITPKTGNLNNDMQGKLKSLEFMRKYFVDSTEENYVTPLSLERTTSHRAAQDAFLMGLAYPNNNKFSKPAFHFDGEWWENESRGMFKSLYESGKKDFEYGKINFQMMPLPAYENSYGADGKGGGFVLPVSENGNIFIKKQTDEKKREGAKKFVSFTKSDEILRLFTRYTGTLAPFEYELTEEDLNGMTTFAKNMIRLKREPGATLVRPDLLKYQSPLNYRIVNRPNRWEANIGGVNYTTPYQAMAKDDGNASPAQLLESLKKGCENWENDYYNAFYR